MRQSILGSPPLASPVRPSLISRGSHITRSSSLDVRRGDHSDSALALNATDTLEWHGSEAPVNSSTFSTNNRATETLPERRRRLGLSAPSAEQSTQETTRGHRWKRETSSHLIELRVTRRDPQKGSPPVEDFCEPTAANQNNVDEKHRYEGAEGTVPKLQQTRMSIAPSSMIMKKDPLKVPSVEYSEGLYCRVRRRLGLKKGLVLVPDGEKSLYGEHSETGMILNHAAELLRDAQDQKSTLNGLSTRTSKLSIAAVQNHRKGGSCSNTSSLRKLFMGKAPLPSPDPAALYTGSNNEQYFRVEMSTPEAPNFLPSEARRVDTPPTPGGNGNGRKLRGFFFDFYPPGEDSDPKSPSWASSNASRKSSKVSGTKTVASDPEIEREWFKVKVATFSDQKNFEFDVPDHLPNSPMCARNPRHTSGGTGICPYHGRARTASTQASDGTERMGASE
ncbi:hypothetical protein MMC34_006913 [Xylographa carneopallida]|nr:hypothetical protein [Xylographa carneopallida]